MASTDEGPVYVVQYETAPGKWQDLGEPIRMPVRSNRKTAIRRIMDQFTNDKPTRVRVLDEESTRAHTVELVLRDPELRIR
jgi:hypothetical protein